MGGRFRQKCTGFARTWRNFVCYWRENRVVLLERPAIGQLPTVQGEVRSSALRRASASRMGQRTNSKFKIQDGFKLEISEKRRTLKSDDGDAKPLSTRHKSPITNRQSTIPGWGLLEHLGQDRISGNSGDRECTAGGRAAGKSGIGGHDVYDNAGTSMKFGNFVIVRMLLMGNRLSKSGGFGAEKRGIKK